MSTECHPIHVHGIIMTKTVDQDYECSSWSQFANSIDPIPLFIVIQGLIIHRIRPFSTSQYPTQGVDQHTTLVDRQARRSSPSSFAATKTEKYIPPLISSQRLSRDKNKNYTHTHTHNTIADSVKIYLLLSKFKSIVLKSYFFILFFIFLYTKYLRTDD